MCVAKSLDIKNIYEFIREHEMDRNLSNTVSVARSSVTIHTLQVTGEYIL